MKASLDATRKRLSTLAVRGSALVQSLAHDPKKLVLRVVGLVAIASVGVVAGIWLQHEQVPKRVVQPIQATFHRLVSNPPQALVAEWRDITTNLHVIQIAAAKLTNYGIDGGSLLEVGGNIIISSPYGQLSYLDARNELHSLNLDVPMNIEGLKKDSLYTDPLFNVASIRTHDLLAIETGEGAYDLYATSDRFAGQCFEFIVSRVSISADDKGVRPTGEWHDVWVAKPCIPLKDRGSRFVGEEGGGRMVRKDDDTLLVSLGDHQFDGYYDSRAWAMDPATDFGKVVELNIKTGASRHFAIGLRNPQGLTIARDGRIWETEHGPQGGDEVNLLVDGENFGWPIVTYGMNYGYPPRNWPANPHAGKHEGYTRPRFAFVPSIGISSIVEPDPQEFPLWDDTLVVCSLRASTLFILKTEGDGIVYAEPIPLDLRLRDIASLRDGRLAILADNGTLLFVRNAEKHRRDVQPLEISGLLSLPNPSLEEAMQPKLASAVGRGRQYFQGTCERCHSVGDEIGIGPPLNGIVGRRIASVPGFGYSQSLVEAGQGEVWTDLLLSSFIMNPKGFAPETKMSETGLFDEHAADLVEYLKATPQSGFAGH